MKVDNGPGCRIEISVAGPAGSRRVTVEAAELLSTVAREALDLWRETDDRPGPARPGPDPDGHEPAGAGGAVLADRGESAGLMPAELNLPARLADRDEDDVDRRAGFRVERAGNGFIPAGFPNLNDALRRGAVGQG